MLYNASMSIDLALKFVKQLEGAQEFLRKNTFDGAGPSWNPAHTAEILCPSRYHAEDDIELNWLQDQVREYMPVLTSPDTGICALPAECDDTELKFWVSDTDQLTITMAFDKDHILSWKIEQVLMRSWRRADG